MPELEKQQGSGRVMSDRVRVLVVDDDVVYRRIIGRTLAELPGVELIASVATIAHARQRLERHEVDVVTLDVVLDGESGLDLLKWIREHHPDVLTILLTSGSRRDARNAVDALLLGAGALILKPSGADAPSMLRRALENELAPLVRRAEALASPTLPAPPEPVTPATPTVERPPPEPKVYPAPREVICVGASTGGPPVVMELLRSLGPSFATPVLLVQHMPAFHVPFYADLLARQSSRRVEVGVHGAAVESGAVYVAPGDRHMGVVRDGSALRIVIDDGPPEHNCRPAVDPLFRSVARTCGPAAVGVVVTGMGTDGARGAQALRAQGAPVVVQDRATSVVWGMPGAVVAANAADAVAPASELARWVKAWSLGGEGRRR